MWECDFQQLEISKEYQEFIRTHPQLEEKLLYYNFVHGEVGRYVDFTSFYPWVNKNGMCPVEHPEIILHPSVLKFTTGEYVLRSGQVQGDSSAKPLPPARARSCPLASGTASCLPCVAPVRKIHHVPPNAHIKTTIVLSLVLGAHSNWSVRSKKAIPSPRSTRSITSNTRGRVYVNTFLKATQEASGWPRPHMSAAEKQNYIDQYREYERIECF